MADRLIRDKHRQGNVILDSVNEFSAEFVREGMENSFKCEFNRISSTYLNEIKINVQFAFRELVVALFSCWMMFKGFEVLERRR